MYTALVAADAARNFGEFLALTIGIRYTFSSQALAKHILRVTNERHMFELLRDRMITRSEDIGGKRSALKNMKKSQVSLTVVEAMSPT